MLLLKLSLTQKQIQRPSYEKKGTRIRRDEQIPHQALTPLFRPPSDLPPSLPRNPVQQRPHQRPRNFQRLTRAPGQVAHRSVGQFADLQGGFVGGLEGHGQVGQGVFDIDAGADGEQRLLVVLAMAERGMGGGEARDVAGWIGYRLFHGVGLCVEVGRHKPAVKQEGGDCARVDGPDHRENRRARRRPHAQLP